MSENTNLIPNNLKLSIISSGYYNIQKTNFYFHIVQFLTVDRFRFKVFVLFDTDKIHLK